MCRRMHFFSTNRLARAVRRAGAIFASIRGVVSPPTGSKWMLFNGLRFVKEKPNMSGKSPRRTPCLYERLIRGLHRRSVLLADRSVTEAFYQHPVTASNRECIDLAMLAARLGY